MKCFIGFLNKYLCYGLGFSEPFSIVDGKAIETIFCGMFYKNFEFLEPVCKIDCNALETIFH